MEQHERVKKALWDHLVRLENNVLVLEDLVSFPGLKMLGAARRVVDWMGQSVYEYTVIIVWRLWGDNDSRSITLERLRRVLSDHVREEYRDALKIRLRSLKPDEGVRDILSRARAVRHGRLAHIDERYRFDEARRVAGISVAELRTVTDFLGSYLNGLQFGVHSMFSLASFERGPDRRSSTEEMLEKLVLNSPWCRRYDDRGAESWWRGFGSRLTDEEVKWLSDLRARSGLDPIRPVSGER